MHGLFAQDRGATPPRTLPSRGGLARRSAPSPGTRRAGPSRVTVTLVDMTRDHVDVVAVVKVAGALVDAAHDRDRQRSSASGPSLAGRRARSSGARRRRPSSSQRDVIFTSRWRESPPMDDLEWPIVPPSITSPLVGCCARTWAGVHIFSAGPSSSAEYVAPGRLRLRAGRASRPAGGRRGQREHGDDDRDREYGRSGPWRHCVSSSGQERLSSVRERLRNRTAGCTLPDRGLARHFARRGRRMRTLSWSQPSQQRSSWPARRSRRCRVRRRASAAMTSERAIDGSGQPSRSRPASAAARCGAWSSRRSAASATARSRSASTRTPRPRGTSPRFPSARPACSPQRSRPRRRRRTPAR